MLVFFSPVVSTPSLCQDGSGSVRDEPIFLTLHVLKRFFIIKDWMVTTLIRRRPPLSFL